MGVGDYAGIYHMVEIPPRTGSCCPRCLPGKDSVNLDSEAEDRLQRAGYIVGRLQRVIFQDPGIKDTNWSATAPVTGPDGVGGVGSTCTISRTVSPRSTGWIRRSRACGWSLVTRCTRWVISALQRSGWTPTASSGGEERRGWRPAWSEGHPLSDAVNQLIASMVRKVGGFTFQELNLSFDDIKKTSERGADLSYDFVNRPAYAHAMATGDTEFLRLTLNAALQHGLQPIRLVHALQNHDEMTYELVHFATGHKDDIFSSAVQN